MLRALIESDRFKICDGDWTPETIFQFMHTQNCKGVVLEYSAGRIIAHMFLRMNNRVIRIIKIEAGEDELISLLNYAEFCLAEYDREEIRLVIIETDEVFVEYLKMFGYKCKKLLKGKYGDRDGYLMCFDRVVKEGDDE